MSGQFKDCITTLPISPIADPNIGLMVLPFVMDVLGEKMNLDKVLSFNVKGEKLYDKQIEDYFSNYLSSCKNLGVYPDFIWRDDQEKNIFWINNFFYQLEKGGYIIKEKADIMKCFCGAVESLLGAENLSPKRKIYRNEKGKKYCNLCNSEIITSKESVYLFCFPSLGKIKIFPEFYAKELSKMTEKFSGFKFLISRSRPSASVLQIGREKIFLDVDFMWQMFLSLLRRYGYNPCFLVGGNKNLMACCFASTMFKLIDEKDINVIIPPYYLAPGRESLKEDEYSLSKLLGKYDVKTIRLLLSTAMNWGKKESVLDINLADLISKMAYRISSIESKANDIKEVTDDFNGIKVKILLSAIRKTRKAFYCKELFGVV